MSEIELNRPPPLHPLSDDQMDLAEALNGDFLELARTQSKFESFSDERIAAPDALLIRYLLETIEAFRTTGEISTRYLFGGSGKLNSLTFRISSS